MTTKYGFQVQQLWSIPSIYRIFLSILERHQKPAWEDHWKFSLIQTFLASSVLIQEHVQNRKDDDVESSSMRSPPRGSSQQRERKKKKKKHQKVSKILFPHQSDQFSLFCYLSNF